jgi:lipopolysaccharide transport system ATP-binding protein
MASWSIHAVGLAKSYRIRHARARYDTLRDELARLPSRLIRRGGRLERETVWAVRDVSFEIDQGELVGIIGRNGAGKTTLLRLLSRITEPTRGYADVRGRLGSLLEVGTGFHPELTGRENIFLNGAILGMRRAEIARKFGQIVEFAGVERYIDTPVKRYSSGMHVRLAFSVAAHLEPEIMLVDEVLAVGDAEFQKRCLGKLNEIGKSGRTVLFVSHNMPTIARLCTRGLLMDGGRLIEDGPIEGIIAKYLTGDHGTGAARVWHNPASAPGGDAVRIRSVRIVNDELELADAVDMRDALGIEVAFDVVGERVHVVPMLALFNEQGAHVFNALDPNPRWREATRRGSYTSTAWVPGNLLNEGRHTVSIFMNELHAGALTRHAEAAEVVAFQVVHRGDGLSAKGDLAQTWGGAVSPLLEWSTVASSALVEDRARA